MKTRASLIILALAFIVTVPQAFSQTSNNSDGIDFLGNVDNGVYRNDFFKFELTLPKGWKVNDGETSTAMMLVGADAVKGKSERSNKAVEESIRREVVLLNVTRKPVGAMTNAMIMSGVLKQPSKHVTPSMVAEATKSLFTSSPALKLTKDVEVLTIAGRKFASMEYVVEVAGQTAKIKYYVTMIDGFAVSFSLSYAEDADLAELSKAWGTLKFSAK